MLAGWEERLFPTALLRSGSCVCVCTVFGGMVVKTKKFSLLDIAIWNLPSPPSYVASWAVATRLTTLEGLQFEGLNQKKKE